MKPEKEKWIILLVLSLIWGSSFILIKKSLEHFNPFLVGALRCLIAGIMLLPIAIKNIRTFPVTRLKWILLAGFSGNFIPMFLFPIAETQTSSIIAGIVNAMMPIFVIIIGAIFWKFSTTRKQIIGVIISFTGACILALGSGEGGEIRFFPIAILLIATLLYAISTTTVKSKLNDIPAKLMSCYVFGIVLFFPSLLAAIFSGFSREFQFDLSGLQGLGFVTLLAVFGTGLAMMLNYRLLNISTPLFASTTTLLMPIVALGWGLLYGEKIGIQQIIGGIIIIAGLIFLRTESKK